MRAAVTSDTLTGINDYLSGSSAFTFEMTVLYHLKQFGFAARHGWSYVDPVENKPRQFDITATRDGSIVGNEAGYKLHLIVECKNVTANCNPIIAHLVRRSQNESFHHLLTLNSCLPQEAVDQKWTKTDFLAPSEEYGTVLTVPSSRSLYSHTSSSDLVAKAVEQVNESKRNDKQSRSEQVVISSGRSVYETWSQSVASARFYLNNLVNDFKGEPVIQALVPCVVVPDGTLYGVEYDDSGKMGNISKIPSFSMLSGITHEIPNLQNRTSTSFCFMPVEVMELSAMKNRIDEFIDTSFHARGRLFL